MGRPSPLPAGRTVTPSAYGSGVGEHQFESGGGGSGEVPSTPLVDRYRTCGSDDLAALYAELGGGARALEAQRLAILAVLDERDAWAVDGARDTIGWVSATDALRRVNAKGVVEVARKLKDLPAIAEVAATGGVSFDQLRSLCVLAAPDTDTHWAAQGPSLEPGQLAAAAAKATRVTRESAQEQEARRHLTWWKARGGGVRGSFYLPDVDADTLSNGLDRLASGYKPAPGDPWDPLPVRRADALVELATLSLADSVIGDPAHLYVHAAAGALGETEVWNLAMLCHRHHKAVHEGGWTITGNPDTPDGLTYVSPTGRVVTTEPEPCSDRVRERLIPDPPDPLAPDPDDDADPGEGHTCCDHATTPCRRTRLEAIRARLHREALRDLAAHAP